MDRAAVQARVDIDRVLILSHWATCYCVCLLMYYSSLCISKHVQANAGVCILVNISIPDKAGLAQRC